MNGLSILALVALLGSAVSSESISKVQYKVKCPPDAIEVEIVKTPDVKNIYLNGLKSFPNPNCHPKVTGNLATLRLDLSEKAECGITEVNNMVTGRTAYYHLVVVELSDAEHPKEVLPVKCVRGGSNFTHALFKRNVLPAGFEEPEDLDITTTYERRAPEPQLGVGVRQGGQAVTGDLNVNPGTALQMDVYLDKDSAPIYGLLVSYMQVTDTKSQEETIIFNGCSVDPYLFENFNTVDGDFLTAKFRAFKFPESTYVQFKGTVNVCLDKCKGVECSNGQVGYGRRRRAVPDASSDAVYKVNLVTYIKVDYTDDELLRKGPGNIIRASAEVPPKRRDATPVLATNGLLEVSSGQQRLQLGSEHVREELSYTVVEERASAPPVSVATASLLALSVLLVLLR